MKGLIIRPAACGLLAAFALPFAASVSAHQPVMDMAPRWNGGYGFQVRHESYGSDKLLNGSSEVANTTGVERHVDTTWLEGVYTFRPSLRFTFKLPYVDKWRSRSVDGDLVHQATKGLGDLIVAMPLKAYTNDGPNTHNWGLTPQIKLPTGSSKDDYALSDGSIDLGLSFSYSAEGYPVKSKPKLKLYQLYDLFYWENREGDDGQHEGDTIGLDINVGVQMNHSNNDNTGTFLIWDISARHSGEASAETRTGASAGTRVHTGPVVMHYRDNLMFRAEYKFAAYEDKQGLSRGDEFVIGVGMAF